MTILAHIRRSGCVLLCVACIMAALIACSSDSATELMGIGRLELSLEDESGAPAPYSVNPMDVCLTLSTADGTYSHTWNGFDRFPQGEQYFAGSYVATAFSGDSLAEGYDFPAFQGKAVFEVVDGQLTEATIPMKLAVALFEGGDWVSECAGFEIDKIELHTPSGAYHVVEREAPSGSFLCLRPGATQLYTSLLTPEGQSVRLRVAEMVTCAGLLCGVTASVSRRGDIPTLEVKCGASITSMPLSDKLLQSAPPTLHYDWAEEFVIPEGETPSEPVVVRAIAGGAEIAHIYLSIASPSLSAVEGLPKECDLLSLTPAQREAFASVGFTPAVSQSGGEIDFSALLSELVCVDASSSISAFRVEAVDVNGLASETQQLTVVTTPVDIEVKEISPALMGVNRAAVTVACQSAEFPSHIAVKLPDAASEDYLEAKCDIAQIGPDCWRVEFTVPSGSEPVEARLLYCGKVRDTVTITRVQPSFSIEVDTYATTAGVRIVAADPELTSIITSGLHLYINDEESALYQRFPAEGFVSVIGLKPSHTYTFKATMMSGVAEKQFTPQITARTESVRQLPNSDFENRERGVTYWNLPAGGRFSQTTVEIFNQCNFITYEQEVPEGWANTNAKTFCLKATNKNSWYMQPSVSLTRSTAHSGEYSVMLSSVAFDPNGEPIPDYAQTGQPYLSYSPVVPHISYRASGKIFLGTYSFDHATLTEHYSEGIPWSSRPLSLNGYYRFLPVEANLSASGLARVEVLGKIDGTEQVIASSEALLPIASTFTAFSVPLRYEHFGVKATAIRVMFASSAYVGSIEEETAGLITIDDPRTATSVGGRLWLDNITLAY